MINETIAVPLAGRALASVVLPPHAVAYAFSNKEEDGPIQIDVAMKTPNDPTYAAAWLRAQREFPQKAWIRANGSRSGGGSQGSPEPYYQLLARVDKHGRVVLEGIEGDPLLSAYRRVSDRDAVPGRGTSTLQDLLNEVEQMGGTVTDEEEDEE